MAYIAISRLETILKYYTWTDNCVFTGFFVTRSLANNLDEEETMLFGLARMKVINHDWLDYGYLYNDEFFQLSYRRKSVDRRQHYNTPTVGLTMSEFRSLLRERLEATGYLKIELRVSFKCNCNLGHSFVICQTDKGEVIVDSYLKHRKAEIRIVDAQELLFIFLTQSTFDNWNILCKSDVKHHHNEEDVGKLEIRVGYK